MKEEVGKRVNIGILGAGFAAELHLHNYAHLRDSLVNLLAVCARTKDKVEAFARRFNIPRVYTNAEALLEDKDIEVIDICTPTNLHHTYAIKAAEAGKHVICEKPLTGYFGEGEKVGERVGREVMYKSARENAYAVRDALKKKGVKLLYAENFVYAPAITKLKRIMKVSGGTVLDIRAEESHSGSHASYARKWNLSGGGSLLRMGSHPVGAVLHIKHYEGILKYGRPIRAKAVVGEVGRLTQIESFKKEERKWLVSDWEDVEDWSAAIITFEDGSKGTIHATDVSLGGVKNLVSIFMSNAVVQVNINPNTSVVLYTPEGKILGDEYITEKVETKSGWQFPSPDEDWMRGYPQELEDFARSILEGREPVSGIDLACEVVEVIYAAYLSAEAGRKIVLS